jgi:hypothetical protein
MSDDQIIEIITKYRQLRDVIEAYPTATIDLAVAGLVRSMFPNIFIKNWEARHIMNQFLSAPTKAINRNGTQNYFLSRNQEAISERLIEVEKAVEDTLEKAKKYIK